MWFRNELSSLAEVSLRECGAWLAWRWRQYSERSVPVLTTLFTAHTAWFTRARTWTAAVHLKHGTIVRLELHLMCLWKCAFYLTENGVRLHYKEHSVIAVGCTNQTKLIVRCAVQVHGSVVLNLSVYLLNLFIKFIY